MNPDTNIHDLSSNNPLHAHQEGEEVICTIKRHPIGMVAIYTAVLVALLGLIILIFVGLPLMGFNDEQTNYYGTIVMLAAAITGAGYSLVAHIIYWGNKWVITSDSITNVAQKGLFVKQASQLSLDDIESVSAEKNGVLMQMFNFGVLKAETAGEHTRFVFLYCPDPENYARQILNAREKFMASEKAKHVTQS